MQPFLDVIKSPEISGPVTGVALAGMHRIITAGMLGMRSLTTCVVTILPTPPSPGHARLGGAVALQAIVDAVTACKYESTDTASDEVVLFRILHVLRASLSDPASTCLSDDHVKTIFEACYRIGQLQPKGGKALLGTDCLSLSSIVVVSLHVVRLK